METPVTRAELLQDARQYIGAKYAAQGRSTKVGFDCGMFPLQVGIDLNLESLQIAGKALNRVLQSGYSQNPDGKSYEAVLDETLERLPEVNETLNRWDAQPADVLAFDLGNGVQHMCFVSKWDGRRFTAIHAVRRWGVHEAPLPLIYALALKHPNTRAYRVRGITD